MNQPMLKETCPIGGFALIAGAAVGEMVGLLRNLIEAAFHLCAECLRFSFRFRQADGTVEAESGKLADYQGVTARTAQPMSLASVIRTARGTPGRSSPEQGSGLDLADCCGRECRAPEPSENPCGSVSRTVDFSSQD